MINRFQLWKIKPICYLSITKCSSVLVKKNNNEFWSSDGLFLIASWVSLFTKTPTCKLSWNNADTGMLEQRWGNKHGRWRGGKASLDFENFSKKKFLVSSGKKQISPLLPTRKFLEKSPSWPPLEKILLTPMAVKEFFSKLTFIWQNSNLNFLDAAIPAIRLGLFNGRY